MFVVICCSSNRTLMQVHVVSSWSLLLPVVKQSSLTDDHWSIHIFRHHAGSYHWSLWSSLFVSDTKFLPFCLCVLVYWPSKDFYFVLVKHEISVLHADCGDLGVMLHTHLPKHFSWLCWTTDLGCSSLHGSFSPEFQVES